MIAFDLWLLLRSRPELEAVCILQTVYLRTPYRVLYAVYCIRAEGQTVEKTGSYPAYLSNA